MITITPDTKKLLAGMLGGFLLSVAAMAAMYAVAATAATSIASVFAAPHPSGHDRITDIADAENRAAAEHRVARAKCKRFGGGLRRNCYAEAEATHKQAVEAARQQ
jgi:hypothetical protein